MQRAGWWGLRIWPRVRIGVRCVAVLSAMLMVLGSASDGLAAPVPHGPSGPPHHAQPAPHQRPG